MDELIKDLKQALIDVIDVVSEVHDNNDNCPYCGSEYESHTPRDTVEYECPNQDCAGNVAFAVMFRANEYLMTTEAQAKLLDAAKRALVEMEAYEDVLYGQRSKTRYQFLRDAIAMAESELSAYRARITT